MELRSFTEESKSTATSSSSTKFTTETTSVSSILSSSLRNSLRTLELSPFRRVRFDLCDSESEGNDSNNVATQTESHFVVGKYCSSTVLEDIRKLGKDFWSSSSIRSITDYMRELDEKPKTGYTYATSLSYDLCGDPNPPMPNMSRYSLDHYSSVHRSGYSLSSRSDSRWSSRNSTSLAIPELDFSMASTTTPETSSGLRKNLSSVCRRIVNLTTTTTTTTTATRKNGHASGWETSTGRVTPESRSGNDRLDGSLHYYKPSSTISSFISTRPASIIDLIKRRFIDIVNSATTTTTVNSEVVKEQKKKRNRNSCLLWPFCLLLLLLPVAGLWSWIPATNFFHNLADRAETTASGFYGGFLPYFFSGPSTNESSQASVIFTKNDSDNVSVHTIYVPYDLKNLPIPKSCCEDVDLIKSQVALILSKLEYLEKQSGDRDNWMKEREALFDKNTLTIEELRTAFTRLEKEISLRKEIVPKIVRERESYSLEDIQILIAKMIRRYDEDKTGEPDHALESAGATVISTRCTEEYKWGYAQYSLFGVPLWSWTTSPRLAIQDEVKPGQCWAFKGDQGYLVIKLAGLVQPTSFTIEHLSRNLSPTGRIDSAPKDFEILGLISEQGPVVSLGKYVYEDNDQPLQNFQIQTRLEENESFPIVELRITSNHGNPDYTCLYRFRVHGRLLQRGY